MFSLAFFETKKKNLGGVICQGLGWVFCFVFLLFFFLMPQKGIKNSGSQSDDSSPETKIDEYS